jgi:hypothetical protein
MDEIHLEQQLAADIETALRQYRFARPTTPDTSITGAYADGAAMAVTRYLLTSGWTLTNARATGLGAAS